METLTLGDAMHQMRLKTNANYLELQGANVTIDYTGLQEIGPGLGLRELRLLLNEYMVAADLVLAPAEPIRFENGQTLWEVKKWLNYYFSLDQSPVEPDPIFGAQLVTDPGLNTGDGWTEGTGWDASGTGFGKFAGPQLADSSLTAAGIVSSTNRYQWAVDIVSLSGPLELWVGGVLAYTFKNNITGTFRGNVLVDGIGTDVELRALVGCTVVTVNAVSIREIL